MGKSSQWNIKYSFNISGHYSLGPSSFVRVGSERKVGGRVGVRRQKKNMANVFFWLFHLHNSQCMPNKSVSSSCLLGNKFKFTTLWSYVEDVLVNGLAESIWQMRLKGGGGVSGLAQMQMTFSKLSPPNMLIVIDWASCTIVFDRIRFLSLFAT